MPKPKPDRAALLDAMANHVLAHGLRTASLRPLAEAAGTSDRMLVYHFGSKDQLIAELLVHLANRMAEGLDAAWTGPDTVSAGRLLSDVLELLRSPEFRPYASVWLEIAAAAGQGDPAHAHAGGAIIDGFLAWTEAKLPGSGEARRQTARMIMTMVEGFIVMDTVGRPAVADDARALLVRLADALS